MPSPAEKPTKSMSMEDFYVATENGNKLMDRVWYCIGATEKDIGDQKIFWEHWFWNEGEESKPLDKKVYKEGSNHTKTVSIKDETVDYPIWPVRNLY